MQFAGTRPRSAQTASACAVLERRLPELRVVRADACSAGIALEIATSSVCALSSLQVQHLFGAQAELRVVFSSSGTAVEVFLPVGDGREGGGWVPPALAAVLCSVASYVLLNGDLF